MISQTEYKCDRSGWSHEERLMAGTFIVGIIGLVALTVLIVYHEPIIVSFFAFFALAYVAGYVAEWYLYRDEEVSDE